MKKYLTILILFMFYTSFLFSQDPRPEAQQTIQDIIDEINEPDIWGNYPERDYLDLTIGSSRRFALVNALNEYRDHIGSIDNTGGNYAIVETFNTTLESFENQNNLSIDDFHDMLSVYSDVGHILTMYPFDLLEVVSGLALTGINKWILDCSFALLEIPWSNIGYYNLAINIYNVIYSGQQAYFIPIVAESGEGSIDYQFPTPPAYYGEVISDMQKISLEPNDIYFQLLKKNGNYGSIPEESYLCAIDFKAHLSDVEKVGISIFEDVPNTDEDKIIFTAEADGDVFSPQSGTHMWYNGVLKAWEIPKLSFFNVNYDNLKIRTYLKYDNGTGSGSIAPFEIINEHIPSPYFTDANAQVLTNNVVNFKVNIQDEIGFNNDVYVVVDGQAFLMNKTRDNSYELTITSISQGNHDFHFESSFMNEPIREPDIGEYPLNITSVEPILTNGSVTPQTGYPSTTFDFFVTYTDPGNQAPDYVYLVVNGNDYTMSGSGTWSAGVEFTKSKQFLVGDYQYHFESEVNGQSLRYPTTGELDFEVEQLTGNGITLSFSMNPLIEGEMATIYATLSPPLDNYPIRFIQNPTLGDFQANNPVNTNANGVAEVDYFPLDPGWVVITALDHLNTSNFVDEDIEIIPEPLEDYVILIYPNYLYGTTSSATYRLYIRVYESDGDEASNVNATITTNMGLFSNNQQTINAQTDSHGKVFVEIYFTNQGLCTVSVQVGNSLEYKQFDVIFVSPPYQLSPFKKISHPDYIRSFDWSPTDSDIIYYNCDDENIACYSISQDQVIDNSVVYKDNANIEIVRVSPDASKISFSSQKSGEQYIRIYNISNGSFLSKKDNLNPRLHFCYGDIEWINNTKLLSGDGVSSTGYSSSILTYSGSSSLQMNSLKSNTWEPKDVSACSTLLAISYGDENGHDGVVSVWNSSGTYLFDIDPHPQLMGKTYAVSISDNGERIAVSDNHDKRIKIYSSTGNLINSVNSELSIYCLKWMPGSERYILSSDDYSNVVLWDMQSGTKVCYYCDDSKTGDIFEIRWSPNGNLFGIVKENEHLKLFAPWDSLGPSISVTYPQNNSSTTNPNIQITGLITDDNPIEYLKCKVNNGSWEDVSFNNNTFTQNVTIIEGDNIIEFNAKDVIGNENTEIFHITLLTDEDPPIVFNPQISDNHPEIGSLILFTAIIQDGWSGVDESTTFCNFHNDDSTFNETKDLYDDGTHGDSVPNDEIFTCQINTTSLNEENYLIDVSAADMNENICYIDDVVSFTPFDYPNFSNVIIQPDTISIQDSACITLTITDQSDILNAILTYGNQSNKLIKTGDNSISMHDIGNNQFRVYIPPQNESIIYFYTEALDGQGNIGISTTYDYSIIDNVKPVISSIIQNPDDVSAITEGEVVITSKVYDVGYSGLNGLPKLRYRRGEDYEPFTNYNDMSLISDNNYTFIIPEPDSGWYYLGEQCLNYQIKAIDNSDNINETVIFTDYIDPDILNAEFVADTTYGIVPLEVSFNDNSEGNPIVWEWDFGDGTDTTYTTYKPTVSHTYNLAGTYDVSLTVSNGTISDTLIKYDYITVTGIPQISLSQDSLDFTIEPPEYEESQTLTIYNTGDDTLEVELSTNITVTDIDGNVYQTVQIGDQLWMVENLKVKHYRNGDPVPHLTDNDDWTSTSSGAYCYYNNNPDNADTYGALYNWYAVDDARELAPEGWHVPTDDEWKQLEMYLGMTQAQANSMGYRGTDEGAMLKEGGTAHWFMEECGNPLCVCPNGSSGCNCSGFSARGGGFRHFMGGTYIGMPYYGQFWTSAEYDITSAIHREIDDNVTTIMRSSAPFRLGFSVRCVRDSDYLTIRQFTPLNRHSVLSEANSTGFDNFDGKLETTSRGKNDLNGWLTYAPTVLSIAPGASADITVTVNAEGMQAGMYADNIIVSSNDPANPILTVPVTMSIIRTITANFIADTTEGNAPLDVTFTDSSYAMGTTITSWEWDFGDGDSSYEQNPVHTYQSAGTYDVSLIVSDGTISDTLTIEDYITVTGIPQISLSQDSLDFTIDPPDYEQSQTLMIYNTGDDTLEVSLYPGTVTDIDGNIYQTVQIGNQLWMAENLRVTHYNDGSEIPNITDNSTWGSLSTGAYCYYSNDPANADTYGALYNWYAVDDARELAPEGWHVPTDDEWQTLVDYLGGSGVAGGKMKSTGTIESGNGLWYAPNNGATNESGFTALPGGYRDNSTGIFYNIGYNASFWSSSEYSALNAWNRLLYCNYSGVDRYGIYKNYGFSVRCIRDSDYLTIRQFTPLNRPSVLSDAYSTGFDTFDEQLETTSRGKNDRDVWLTYTPTVLSIAPGASEDVTVTVNAEGMQAGMYADNIIVSSNDPANPILTVPVTMSIIGTITANFTADTTEGNAPLDVTFTDSSYALGTTITSWEWDFGDGDSSSEQNPVHTYQSAGTYDVSLIVSDGTISDTLTIEDYITVTGIPQISLSQDSLDFTIEPPDYEQSQTLMIYNTGDDTLEVSLYPSTVTDIDGNVYQTVQIGNQLWMAENLTVTHYRNGDAIPNVTDNSQWTGLSTGAYCYYNNNPDNANTYGALYNWYAVDDSRNIAPEGWHVPTDEEIKELEMCLGMSQAQADDTGWRGTNEGSQLAGNSDLWYDGELENNALFGSSGFTALPGGYRTLDSGSFYGIGSGGYFWSSTEYNSYNAWERYLHYDYTEVSRGSNLEWSGFSVRCVRDSDYLTIRPFTPLNRPSVLSEANSTGFDNFDGKLETTSRGKNDLNGWLTYAPTVLSIAPGASADITVTVNAEGIQAGMYADNIIVSSNDPANPILTVPVTMSVVVTITANFTADTTEGNAPLDVTFTDSSYAMGTTITSWEWHFGDGADSTYTVYQNTVEHTYNLDGTYDVSLIVSDGTISDTLTIEDYITVFSEELQTVDLTYNWNIISFYVEPSDMNMESIMQPLIDDSTLIKVQDEAGNVVVYLQGIGWFNSIEDMSVTEGYLTKVSFHTQLIVNGTPVVLPLDIFLKEGWNIMGYPCQIPQNALAVVQPLIDNGTLIKVQDEAGGAVVYLTGIGWYNTIGDMQPGEGYYVKVSENDTLTIHYPTMLVHTHIQLSNRERINKEYHFKPIYPDNGYKHMTVFIKNNNYHLGDEIGIYDGDRCVGSGVINNDDIICIVSSYDDPTTDVLDGFIENNQITFKIWDSEYHREIEDIQADLIIGDGTFHSLGTAYVDLTYTYPDIPINNYLGDCYPNPFQNNTIIKFGLKEQTDVEISIYNIKGQKVCTLLSDVLESDHYNIVWNGMGDNNKAVSNGIYFIMITSDNYTQYKKLIKIND